MSEIQINDLTRKIIGCAMNVHRKLGPGFLESVYQAGLAYELTKQTVSFEREKGLSVKYGESSWTWVSDATFLLKGKLSLNARPLTLSQRSTKPRF